MGENIPLTQKKMSFQTKGSDTLSDSVCVIRADINLSEEFTCRGSTSSDITDQTGSQSVLIKKECRDNHADATGSP